jgi:outer membrane protein TolC
MNATFGLSNNNDAFSEAFNNLKDQEIVGMSISIPIMDWGQSEGRVKMARAQAETRKLGLEQSMQDYKQDLLVKVMQFNNQRTQCEISKRASEIADESYQLALENFGNGSMSVTDLNSLQNERDNARQSYVNNVRSYWSYYFTIRRLTLFDYVSNTNISTEFDKLIK